MDRDRAHRSEGVHDELENITPENKALLKTSFDDLAVDSPRTHLAVSRYQKIVGTLAPVAKETLQKNVVEFLTNTAKSTMGMS